MKQNDYITHATMCNMINVNVHEVSLKQPFLFCMLEKVCNVKELMSVKCAESRYFELF